MRQEKGFSLFETLIYITIVSAVLLAALGILTLITRINSGQVARTEVDRNLDFINQRFTYWGLRAKAIYPFPATSTDEVRFIADDTFGKFWFDSASSTLKFQEATGTSEDLSTSRVLVTPAATGGKLFEIRGDTVQIKIKVTYRGGINPYAKYERVAESSVSVRSQGALWPDGLVGYWGMEQNQATSTQLFDESGNGNEGTIRGSALKFSETAPADYVDVPDAPEYEGMSALTIEAWVYRDDIDGATCDDIVQKENTYNLKICTNLEGWVHNGTSYVQVAYANGSSVPNRIWTHIVFTWTSGSAGKMYVNGEDVTAGGSTQAGTAWATTNSLRIGSRPNVPFEYFNGTIDEVRLYTRALSSGEAKEHFNQQFLNSGGLVLYIPFSNRSGTSASTYPYSGPLLPGTLVNFSSTLAEAGDTSSSGWTTYGRPNRATPGKFGKAGQFNGKDDTIEIPDSTILEGMNAITIEAWTNTQTGGGLVQNIVRKEYAYRLALNGLLARTEAWIHNGTSDVKVAHGAHPIGAQWYHIAATWNTGSSGTLYINGVVATTASSVQTGSVNNSASLVVIGAKRDLSVPALYSDFFGGMIDEVRIYKRVLSAGEISLHYNALK